MTSSPSPSPAATAPRLSLSHATLAVRDLDAMLDFYCDVLGFAVTNRGTVGDEGELVFISQDPTEHHQIVFVAGPAEAEHQFVMVDHMAFRTGSLDDLRAIGARLEAAEVEGVIPIDHGNAWSLYFNDPEGNGLECFVDSPFHVSQPFAEGLDLGADDAAIEADTRAKIQDDDEFQSLADWQAAFRTRLDGGEPEA